MDYLYQICDTHYLLQYHCIHNRGLKHQILDFSPQGRRFWLKSLGRFRFSEAEQDAIAKQTEFCRRQGFMEQGAQYNIFTVEQFEQRDYSLFFSHKRELGALGGLFVDPRRNFGEIRARFLGKQCVKAYGDGKLLTLVFIDFAQGADSLMGLPQSQEHHLGFVADVSYEQFYRKKYDAALPENDVICYCRRGICRDVQAFESYDSYDLPALSDANQLVRIPFSLLRFYEQSLEPIPPALGDVPLYLGRLLEAARLQELILGTNSCCGRADDYKFWRYSDQLKEHSEQYFEKPNQQVLFQSYLGTLALNTEARAVGLNDKKKSMLQEYFSEEQFNSVFHSILSRKSTYRQRLEFLGDAVLGHLLTSKITSFGASNMHYKARLVSNDFFCQIYQYNVQILQKIALPLSTVKNKPTGDALEAIFGFLYLLYGLDFCNIVICKLMLFPEYLQQLLVRRKFNLPVAQERCRQYYDEQYKLIEGTIFDFPTKNDDYRVLWLAPLPIDGVWNLHLRPNTEPYLSHNENIMDLAQSLCINQYIEDSTKPWLYAALQEAVEIGANEALEMAGDAFLKLTESVMIFLAEEFASEGVMTLSRQLIENNNFLGGLLHSRLPFGTLETSLRFQYERGSKHYGDVFEAIIGAVLQVLDVEAAGQFIKNLIHISDNMLLNKYELLTQLLKSFFNFDIYMKNATIFINDKPILQGKQYDGNIYRIVCQLACQGDFDQALRDWCG